MTGEVVGRTIGNYIVTGELASGGMGVVYRARHVTLPRDAVVKCIRPFTFSEETRRELRERFRREAHIQSQLDHPHVVRVFEFFDFDDEYFLIMEYVAGTSVRSMLDRSGRLPPSEATSLAAQALEGLAHAHGFQYVDQSGNTGVGIIHRDVKPGNLLVDERGNLKLADFGIAKVRGDAQLTSGGFSPGTVEYMSPEQIRGLAVDSRSDLYSLGVTLYEMLSGRVPFPPADTDSGYDLLKAHVETDPPPIRDLNPEIAPSLAYVVTRALDRDPDLRWQTAAEFREALVSHEQNRTVLKVRKPVKRRRPIAYAIAALALAVIVFASFWIGREKPSVVVLPFEDISPEKNQEYIADGLTEELLNSLAQTPELRVTGKASSFQFKGKTGDIVRIRKTLNVGAILEGSVRKNGNRAKISVRLINAGNGFHLWASTFDRELNDIPAVEDEIARSVRSALKINLLAEKPRAPAKGTTAEAYDVYLQGRYFIGKGTQENIERAVGFFEQAIRMDASYSAAWAGLAEAKITQARRGDVPADEGYPAALRAVNQALALDPNLGLAHVEMGLIRVLYDWDWANAEASYQRALALEPGRSGVIGLSATLARIRGHLDEAIALDSRLIQIEPLLSGVYHNAGLTFYCAGRYPEATEAFKKSLDLSPKKEITHAMLSEVHLAQAQPREALAEAEKEKNDCFRLFSLALVKHQIGNHKESDANLAELTARFSEEAAYQISEVHAFRGEADLAFEWLDRAYAARDSGISLIKEDPLMRGLKADPRFLAVLKKMRLD